MEIGDLQLSNKKLKDYCKELKQKITLNNKVLFINCPQFNLDTFEQDVAKNRCYYAYPPTGLQYLDSAISKRGLEIDILDLNYEFLKRVNSDNSFRPKDWLLILEEYLENHNPSIIGISNLFYVDAPYFKKVLKFLRDRKQKSIILAGGQNATYNAEKILNENLCDFVCKREAENKINFLFDNLYEYQKHKPTPGILFKFKGKIEETRGEKDFVELKGNLIDSHKKIRLKDYCMVGSLSPYSRMAGKDTPFAGIFLNRGCRGGCKFCDVVNYMGRGVRSRETKDFLDEIEYLNKEKGIGFFEFLDDDFTIYKTKTLEVLQGIIDRNLQLKWASTNGIIALSLDDNLMEKMRDSGCIGFHIGVESGNPEILKKMRKPGTLKTFKEFSKRAQKFPEMFIIDNYIVGFPKETFKEMMDSFKFSIDMNLDWSNFTRYQPNVSYSDLEEPKREGIGDFLPAKDVLEGKLSSSEKILTGLDVFNMSQDEIPSREQMSQVWFTFDLVRNFILNKNLKPGGDPEKFISWVKVIQERYPTQAHLSLFLSLAYSLKDNQEQSGLYYRKMKKNLKEEYWKQKFKEFGLMEIVDNFPKDAEQSKKALNSLRERYDKMKWKIIILGASGLIGHYLKEELTKQGREVIGTYYNDKKEGLVNFDVTNSSLNDLDLQNVKYAVLCSAMTKLDECKKNPERSREVNIVGLKKVLSELAQKKIIPIFLSSASVFDGIDGNYNEESKKNPTTVYGEQKAEIDDFITSNFKDYLIIRPGKVFGVKKEEGVLFSNWFEKYKKEEEIICADDEKLSPIYVEDLARGIILLIGNNKRGIWHLNPQEHYNRFEMANNFFNYLNIKNAKIKRCSIDDFDFLEVRPKNTFLDASKFIKETEFKFTKLEECYELIKESKKNIYVIQLGTGSNVNLLPLAAGQLVSRLKMEREVLNKNKINKIIFKKEDPVKIVSRMSNVSVVGFSCFLWNMNHTLAVAKETKKRFPDSLIVLGGPSIPKQELIEKFFTDNSFVDIICIDEGEEVFTKLCKNYPNTDFEKIEGIIYRDRQGEIKRTPLKSFVNMDKLPSPYIDGTFDDLYNNYPREFSGIILETNRGCPYSCAYCTWGNQPFKKIREKDMETVRKEVEWVGKNKINYISMADANFGMREKDIDFVDLLVRCKKETGYPNFISVSWAKGQSARVLEIGEKLKDAGIGFRITSALQSLNEESLRAINRQNMGQEKFGEIKQFYRKNNLYSYTELIFGLPCETFDSYLEGLERLLSPNIFDQIYAYPLILFPNTLVASGEYREKYGISSVETECVYTKSKFNNLIKETVEIASGTKSMPREQWIKAFTLSYFTLAVHDDRLLFFPLNYMKKEFGVKIIDFIKYSREKSDAIGNFPITRNAFSRLKNCAQEIQSESKDHLIRPVGYGGIPFDPAEGVFLEMLLDKSDLYLEFLEISKNYFKDRRIDFNEEELEEVFRFQDTVMASPNSSPPKNIEFKYDWINYFRPAFNLSEEQLKYRPQKFKVVDLKPSKGDAKKFLKNHFDVRGVPALNLLYNEQGEKVFPPIKL